LANAVGKLFTYDVEGVEEEHITFRRNNVRHVVTEKQQPLRSIHGELEIFVGREPVKVLWSIVNVGNAPYQKKFLRITSFLRFNC